MDIDGAYFQDEPTQPFDTQESVKDDHIASHTSPERPEERSPMRTSPDPTVENAVGNTSTQFFTAHVGAGIPTRQGMAQESTTPAGSPTQQLLSSPSAEPHTTSPAAKSSSPKSTPTTTKQPRAELDTLENVLEEPSRSPSDGSSPIRPIVRKSSLNFASLPAREPITHKSIGNRISRTSHLDLNRTSYYHRPTEGRSLGHARQNSTDDENDDDDDDDDDDDEMDTDDEPDQQQSLPTSEPENPVAHNKTYTQRLQDQINKLGQTQAKQSGPPKSIPDSASAHQVSATSSNPQSQLQRKTPSSPKQPTTPGAFPEDDEDDWIKPLGSPDNASRAFSPRPGMPKSHSADVMEGLTGKQTVGESDFTMPKTRQRTSRSKSPEYPTLPDRTGSTLGHQKSVSAPILSMKQAGDDDSDNLKKTISVSNPTLTTVFESERPSTPKSPSRGFRDGPLKQVKNKLSSILKSSRGLLVSSAAVSAEGKTSLLSPSTTRLGMHVAPSTDSLQQTSTKDSQPLYPDLTRHATDNHSVVNVASPIRMEGRRTRASIEREKAEEKRREKEAKEARRVAEQMEKLEKAREKEREKARVFSKEQDRVAAMEKQVAAQKEQEKKVVPPTPKQPAKLTRMSPRKTKAQLEAEAREAAAAAAVALDDQPTDDIEMIDATNPMPPPSVPRSAAPASATKPREIKRPLKPAREPVVKAKQAPTVIRVNMNSQNSQHHPSNSTLSSSLHDTLSLSNSQAQLKSKASQPSLQAKPSLQSLKSSASSTGRPKALELAARRKEQEEREAQRKRDVKAEMERKRTAMQEEERRQEQQRKLEAERQREEERKQTEAKKNAQRQAALEKAKQTRAPPPAVRNQPNGPPDYSKVQDQAQRAEASVPRPPSRMNTTAHRSQEELGRPVNATLSGTSKPSTKRALQQDENTDKAVRQGPNHPGATYQTKESKRMRMTDEFDDDFPPANQSSLKGAPIRPSGGYKKVSLHTRQLLELKLISYLGYAKQAHVSSRLYKCTAKCYKGSV